MKLKAVLFLSFVFALHAVAPGKAIADEVGPDSEIKSSWTHFEDLYKDSRDEQTYAASLKDASPTALHEKILGLRGVMALSCVAGGVVVALSAVTETVPFLGVLPRIPTMGDRSDYEEDATIVSAIGGGALDAIFGTLRIPFEYLATTQVEQPYKLARVAYTGTADVAADLLSRRSSCVTAIDKIQDIKTEFKRRKAGKIAAVITKVAEEAASKHVATVENPTLPADSLAEDLQRQAQ